MNLDDAEARVDATCRDISVRTGWHFHVRKKNRGWHLRPFLMEKGVLTLLLLALARVYFKPVVHCYLVQGHTSTVTPGTDRKSHAVAIAVPVWQLRKSDWSTLNIRNRNFVQTPLFIVVLLPSRF